MPDLSAEFLNVWHSDPAASGWRSRMFLVNNWQLIAYDDGRWEIRHALFTVAFGNESNGDLAKERTVHVHAALTAAIDECADPQRLNDPSIPFPDKGFGGS